MQPFIKCALCFRQKPIYIRQLPYLCTKRKDCRVRTGNLAYLGNARVNTNTRRNTRRGRSIESVRAQLARIEDSTYGTDTWYRNRDRLRAIAQRYITNIQNEIERRAVNNPNAANTTQARIIRDYGRERYAELGRNVYSGSSASTAAKGNSVH